jgi:hypothetical protein
VNTEHLQPCSCDCWPHAVVAFLSFGLALDDQVQMHVCLYACMLCVNLVRSCAAGSTHCSAAAAVQSLRCEGWHVTLQLRAYISCLSYHRGHALTRIWFDVGAQHCHFCCWFLLHAMRGSARCVRLCYALGAVAAASTLVAAVPTYYMAVSSS